MHGVLDPPCSLLQVRNAVLAPRSQPPVPHSRAWTAAALRALGLRLVDASLREALSREGEKSGL